jgi:hypothetical protein
MGITINDQIPYIAAWKEINHNIYGSVKIIKIKNVTC